MPQGAEERTGRASSPRCAANVASPTYQGLAATAGARTASAPEYSQTSHAHRRTRGARAPVVAHASTPSYAPGVLAGVETIEHGDGGTPRAPADGGAGLPLPDDRRRDAITPRGIAARGDPTGARAAKRASVRAALDAASRSAWAATSAFTRMRQRARDRLRVARLSRCRPARRDERRAMLHMETAGRSAGLRDLVAVEGDPTTDFAAVRRCARDAGVLGRAYPLRCSAPLPRERHRRSPCADRLPLGDVPARVSTTYGDPSVALRAPSDDTPRARP